MPEVLVKPKPGRGGVGFADDDSGEFGGRGGGEGPQGTMPFDTAQVGLWALLGSLTMLFAAFSSAYLVRRTAADWTPLRMPALLWFNTGLLLASSGTMEWARFSLRQWRLESFRTWIKVTFSLGLAFLAGQILAWRQLAAQGVYLQTNPHSSFFYVLTGVHGVHVLGGILALAWVMAQSRRNLHTPVHWKGARLSATYWHFVDGLWLYLFLMLFVW